MGLELTEKDFRNAEFIIKKELINPLTRDNVFCKGVYWILSGAENHKKQLEIYYKLLDSELDTPESVINNKQRLHEIIKKARFPKSKEKYISKFSKFWLESEIPEKILDDANNGRQCEFELRDQLAKEAPGIGPKCASCLLNSCGYKHVVPVDLWILRFLEDGGYEVKVPDYKTVGGLTKKEYLEYEKIISDRAREYNVSPVILQAAVWSKYSKWSDLYNQTTFSDFYHL